MPRVKPLLAPVWRQRRQLVVIFTCYLVCAACSHTGQGSTQASQAPPTLLPGQQLWKDNISSFLFGTNDTQEWSANNIETSTPMQQALQSAHFTLMRTFFFDRSLVDHRATTDSQIEQRLKTIERSGMTCLGVLVNIFNAPFDTHVVSYAGSRCDLYEFGNEPDYSGISVDTYLKQWNTLIPRLRKINPRARFIGPVTGNMGFLYAFLQGVKASRVLPDAISFHWYACWQRIAQVCLGQAGNVRQLARQIRALIRETLGKELPIGVSEWNADGSNPPPAYGNDATFITTFTALAIQAMALAGVAFACQFDAASYAGYGRLDLFDVHNNSPRPQYYALKTLIQQYRT
ncbi:MAG TPA: hypothetical protein VFA09_24430 [Ktedonobacteraceae bacterium]|nr:hypothetical protein [Ktedonobacteraceae bacterium]